MSEQGYTYGRVVWRELMTRDAAKVRPFYAGLFGWTYEDVQMGQSGNYTLIHLGGKQIGGLWQMRPDQAGPPLWMSYVSVPDVDAVARTAVRLGGKVVRGPADIPDIGRFAVLQDFSGALIVAFHDFKGDPTPEPPKPGEFCWESLGTPDVPRAKEFYGALFGWKTMKGWSEDGGLFTTDGTEAGQAANFQENTEFAPIWVPHVRVEKLGPVCDRAAELGGEVTAFISSPSLGRFAVIVDPAGGRLSLYGPAGR
jgi:predicted enzyme related to lactoylglutathione lyase